LTQFRLKRAKKGWVRAAFSHVNQEAGEKNAKPWSPKCRAHHRSIEFRADLSSQITDAEKEAILGGNLARMLKLG